MAKKKNVIILTPGLVGSSLFSALLSKAGYWYGDETKIKEYDTWENAELVELNKKIIEAAQFNENWHMEFHPDFMSQMAAKIDQIDPAPYQAFMEKCQDHAPWIWKDPRLMLTIGFWRRFIDPENTYFLYTERDLAQVWISITLRRQVQSKAHLKGYLDGVRETAMMFLEQEHLSYAHLYYDDLVIKPEETITLINKHLDLELTIRDLESVFHGRLYKHQHGIVNYIKALLIYFKSYNIRHIPKYGK